MTLNGMNREEGQEQCLHLNKKKEEKTIAMSYRLIYRACVWSDLACRENFSNSRPKNKALESHTQLYSY